LYKTVKTDLALFNLDGDLAETTNHADRELDVVRRLQVAGRSDARRPGRFANDDEIVDVVADWPIGVLGRVA